MDKESEEKYLTDIEDKLEKEFERKYFELAHVKYMHVQTFVRLPQLKIKYKKFL